MSVEFQDNSEQVMKMLENALVLGLYDAGRMIKTQTQQNSRNASSQTKNAWEYIVNENNMETTIGNPLENSLWEEMGTGEFALHGDGRKGAWYVPVDGYTGKKNPTYNGKVVVVYGKNGKKFFKTNGKKPQRMLQSAFNTKKNAVIKAFKQRLKEVMK